MFKAETIASWEARQRRKGLGLISLHSKGMLTAVPFANSKNWLVPGPVVSQPERFLRCQNIIHNTQRINNINKTVLLPVLFSWLLYILLNTPLPPNLSLKAYLAFKSQFKHQFPPGKFSNFSQQEMLFPCVLPLLNFAIFLLYPALVICVVAWLHRVNPEKCWPC